MSLSDLLFRASAADSAEVAEPSAARLDEIDLAWGERGLPKLPPTTAPGDGAGQPASTSGDDDPPRPDLKFL